MVDIGRKLVADSFKVCVCGPEGSGKTSLLLKYLQGKVQIDEYDPTIEDTHLHTIKISDKPCNLQILDTGGSNSLKHLHEKWYKESDAFIVVFNVTDVHSLQAVTQIIEEIKTVKSSLVENIPNITSYSHFHMKETANEKNKKVRVGEERNQQYISSIYSIFETFVIAIVGTQGDKREKREVSREEAMKLSYFYSCNYFESSALYGENLDLLFSSLVSDLRLSFYHSKFLGSQSSHNSNASSNLLLNLKNIALLTRSNSKDKKEIKIDKKTKKAMKKNSEYQTIQLLKEWINQIDDRGLSIIQDSSLRNQLISSIPSFRIAPLLSYSSIIKNSVSPIFSAVGPPLPSPIFPDYNDFPPLSFKDYVCCKSISAYPIVTAIPNVQSPLKSIDSSFPSPEKKDTPTSSFSSSSPPSTSSSASMFKSEVNKTPTSLLSSSPSTSTSASTSKSIPPQATPPLKKRQGDPICDQYCISLFENRVIFALADGCNWGENVREAAQKAVKTYVEYVSRHQRFFDNPLTTTTDIGHVSLRALQAAQWHLLEGLTEESLFQVGVTYLINKQQGGTTTILGGMMVEILDEVPSNASNENYSPQESTRSNGSVEDKQLPIQGVKTGLSSVSKTTTRSSETEDNNSKGGYSTESSSKGGYSTESSSSDSESSLSKRRSNYNSFKSTSSNSNSASYSPSNTTASNSTTISSSSASTMDFNYNINIENPRWMCVMVSLGDCKAYKWKAKTGEVEEITVGNRRNITDGRDPGGRLGPYREPNGLPDLRNCCFYHCFCEEGDIIFLMTDGVHDNLDPQNMGKSPKELGVVIKDNSWQELDKIDKSHPLYLHAEKLKFAFSSNFINKMIGGTYVAQPPMKTTPYNIACKMIDHVLDLTKPSRLFMEQNPDKRLPVDFVKYPGKMDHATCVAFQVGRKKNTITKNDDVFKNYYLFPPLHKDTNPPASLYWETYTTPEGEQYFYNIITGEATWEDPFVRGETSPWKAFHDPTGTIYYYNTITGESSWENP